MMNYDEFKAEAVEGIKAYLTPEQADKLVVHTVTKVNREKDAIFLAAESDYAVPNIYIDDLYERYLQGANIKELLSDSAKMMICIEKVGGGFIPTLDFSNAKDNIVFQLINTEQNKEMLSNMPHREFHDLSVIYRWVVEKGEEGLKSAIVHNALAKKLGLKEEQLFALAMENTKRIFPPRIRTMQEVMWETYMEIAMFSEMEESPVGQMLEDIPPEQMIWVLSNDIGVNGAAIMLYEEQLHNLAETLQSNFYIIPSSVHEIIAVPSFSGTPEELAEMVEEVNMTEVSLEERLSNQVYCYDKDLRRITLVTDTPKKRLDVVNA